MFLSEHLDQVGEVTESDQERENKEDHEKAAGHIPPTGETTETTDSLPKGRLDTTSRPESSQPKNNVGIVTTSSGEKLTGVQASLSGKGDRKAVAGSEAIVAKDPQVDNSSSSESTVLSTGEHSCCSSNRSSILSPHSFLSMYRSNFA